MNAIFAVFDLDGTIADDSHRQHFVNGPKRDFKSYYARMSMDTPIEPVVAVLRKIDKDPESSVEIWTGRPDSYSLETQDWLRRHRIPFDLLRMRREGDNRPVHEVKAEWFYEVSDDPDIGPPNIVFEDRTRTVEFFRDEGVVCLQVQQHDY